jgi:hypothetical protein
MGRNARTEIPIPSFSILTCAKGRLPNWFGEYNYNQWLGCQNGQEDIIMSENGKNFSRILAIPAILLL